MDGWMDGWIQQIRTIRARPHPITSSSRKDYGWSVACGRCQQTSSCADIFPFSFLFFFKKKRDKHVRSAKYFTTRKRGAVAFVDSAASSSFPTVVEYRAAVVKFKVV
jgi:hypothetical protein